ncbi:MAG: helicase-associated domain-containing protein, partial [Anaerolineae bacterium]|nr:helicase-associated domain-containing protein [Anaerolineae bacterium]
NDLSRVPGLVLQTTGWENSPLLARSKILGFLAQPEILTEAWLSLDTFVARIKQTDPDFQRPHGDYERWYIYDRAGNALMGFDHWDQVDGALIRYLINHILFWLGLVDLGLTAAAGPPTAFRLTELGLSFISNQPPPPLARKPQFIRITPTFQAHVPPGANLYDRFQLARFAELEQREAQRVTYRITQASVGRALRNGVTADQMVAFLGRATNNQTPLKVVETLRTWGKRQGTAYLERVTLLRLKEERHLTEISQNPAFKSLLGEVIGPTTILVPSENTLAVRRLLLELGYLSESDDPHPS